MAAQEAKKNVMPPTNMVIMPAWFAPSSGHNLIIRNTPAFTMVEECSSAEVGVGATIAPSSQPEKGIMAALVKPQKTNRATIISTGFAPCPSFSSAESSTVWYCTPSQTIAAAKATPPSRFIHKALKELLMASSVWV